MSLSALFNKVLCSALRPGVSFSMNSARWASKGNRPCRQDKQQKGQEYGWKLRNGHYAKEGTMLVKQRTPRFHPGLNVVVKGNRLSLHAAIPGKVLITQEKVNLNYTNKKIAAYYEKRDLSVLHKKYYHVIPPPQKNEFQLVAQI